MTRAGEFVEPVDVSHVVLSGDGSSAAYPRLEVLADGRLAAGFAENVNPDYFAGGDWVVKTSADHGRTWELCDDDTVPFAWPASSTRERHDRATRVLPDGTWWAAGVVGWQLWPEEQRERAVAEHRFVTPTTPAPGHIGVGTNTMFIQRSWDRGLTWTRREIDLPPAGWTLGLPRDVTLADGTVLLPLRQRSWDGGHGRFLAARITPGQPDLVRIFPVPRDIDGLTGSEAAVAHVGDDRVVMLMRADSTRGGDGRLLSSWSDDGGRTWTFPVVTEVWGRPPHLLVLADGRLLATYGHQRAPFGVMAVVSEDGGETWSTEQTVLVAELGSDRAGSTRRVAGYHPMTVELTDGALFTCYYVLGGPHGKACGVRWRLPW
ncbi:exo-alpha-sialidase [Jiangella asiatica]|nr:exo-alpha-sialidase [Jiangella asiatica]